MGKHLVITEKPSVARDIASALGGFSEGKGEWLESEDYVVTWAIGHLLELAEPEDYDPKLKSWSLKNLPILPEAFQIRPREGQKKRLDGIRKLGRRKDVDGLINACDAGREGELIFRRVTEYTGLDKQPHERLWLQSMTSQSIRDAFDQLRPGQDLDRLGDAAFLRAVGDWLIGMNATRALTQRLKSRGERGSWSAGRVQTPTLNLMVQREREILAHEPRDYWLLEADFTGGAKPHTWTGKLIDDGQGADTEDPDYRAGRLFDHARSQRVLAAVQAAKAGVASEKRKKSKQNPPLPFDLTSLQREANKRYSMSARRTLDAAQRLYEGHKLLTYPRTDSRHLPDDYGPKVNEVLDAYGSLAGKQPWSEIGGVAAGIVSAGPQNLGRVLDQSKVSDHFAIVPTGKVPGEELHGDDLRIFELAVRQFLASLMGPATWATVERLVQVDLGESKPAVFRTTARSLEIPGFLEALGQEAGQGTQLPALVPGEDKPSGVGVAVETVREEAKQTRPPTRYSEAQLLRMMETAGEQVDDEELSEAMRGRGLGTPATRADTIERLVNGAYARRVAGRLAPSSKAMRLMDVLERVDGTGLASPKLTGEWQYQLNRVEQGDIDRAAVQMELTSYTQAFVANLVGFEHETLYAGEEPVGTCPECGKNVGESAWGYPCEANQGKDSGCSFMLWKDRAGRYIDRKLAGKLLAERTVPDVQGFVVPGGREFSTGTVTLAKDDASGRWRAEIQWGEQAEAVEEVAGDSLWPCPAHEDCSIVETNVRFVCAKVLDGSERRGPVLPRIVCQREMSPDEVAAFFTEPGKTDFIEGFISKRGRPFKGLLFRKPTGKHGFEFPPRAPRKGAGKGAAAKKASAKKPAAKKKAPAKKKSTRAKSKSAAAKSE